MSGSRWRGGYSSYSGTRIVLSELSSAATLSMVGEYVIVRVEDERWRTILRARYTRCTLLVTPRSIAAMFRARHREKRQNYKVANYRQDGA